MPDYLIKPITEKAINDLLKGAANKSLSELQMEALSGTEISLETLAVLLNISSVSALEPLAGLARSLSLRHHGKAVLLYTPLYLSNICINGCRYCSYSADKTIRRKVLDFEEVIEEAKAIKNEGLRHILLLSGEAEQALSFEAFCKHIELVSPLFSSVSVETYALEEQAYKKLESLGITGVTLYQETYDAQRYSFLHEYGPKADYLFRFQAPERVAKANIRQMNMGVLLGLSDYRKDLISLIQHGRDLEKSYPELELSFSLPRLILDDEAMVDRLGLQLVSDFDFVKALIVLRLAFPRASLNCSTRESFQMRRSLVPLGINKMSAGVSTAVGGRVLREVAQSGDEQFKISDESSLSAVCEMLKEIGYMPILSDWQYF